MRQAVAAYLQNPGDAIPEAGREAKAAHYSSLIKYDPFLL